MTRQTPIVIVLILFALIVIGASYTSSRTDITVYVGASRGMIQKLIDDAAESGRTLVFAPGEHKIESDLWLKDGVRILGYGATLVGTKDGQIILRQAQGTHVEGLTFKSGARGQTVTGIGGSMIRCKIINCGFWTTLKFGIDGTGLISEIDGCAFGLAGPWTESFQAMRIANADNSTNFWKVRDSHFYHGTGEYAIEFRNGFQVELSGCNIEKNRTKGAAVKLAGMFSANIWGNWFEDNTGEYQIALPHSDNRENGNKVVHSHDNTWVMADGNRGIFDNRWGSTGISFDHETVLRWGTDGKVVAHEAGELTRGRNVWVNE